MVSAILVGHVDTLRGGVGLSCTHLQFGTHFCQDLFPTPVEIDQAIEYAQTHGWTFSLVTPYVTDRGLNRLEQALDLVERRLHGVEVVVNDWGVLALLQGRNLTPVGGRTFSKGKRDPRIQTLYATLPEPLQAYYRRTNVTDRAWVEFFKRYGVTRVEIDIPPWGLDVTCLRDAGISVSIYYPFSYVTTAVNCPMRPYGADGEEEVCSSQPCNRISADVRYPGLTAPLLLRGNTYYINPEDYGSRIPNHILADIPGLRLVYEVPVSARGEAIAAY